MWAQEFAQRVQELSSRREPFALATVTKTEGSTLAKTGFKILIAHDGEIVGGTLGGGCPEGPIVELAKRTMKDGVPQLLRVHLVDAEQEIKGTFGEPKADEIYVETNCGGTLDVFVEPMLPAERLVIVGQGGKDDVEEGLVHLGKALGFEVVVVDPAPQLHEEPDRVIEASDLDLKALPLGCRDSVIVLTKGERDVGVLESLAHANARFVGLLASRHRLQKDLGELASHGVPKTFLEGLHAPIGLDIGAKTPAELALAILADVIATKYGKDVSHHANPG
ncbi:MAG TPA: XdhC family protein [Thermoplasmata archaeon]|nr:XdhC family protein [Thermoplasmata archaeon]